jgi:hypothetical protein
VLPFVEDKGWMMDDCGYSRILRPLKTQEHGMSADPEAVDTHWSG